MKTNEAGHVQGGPGEAGDAGVSSVGAVAVNGDAGARAVLAASQGGEGPGLVAATGKPNGGLSRGDDDETQRSRPGLCRLTSGELEAFRLLSPVRPPRAAGDFVYVAQCEATGRLKAGMSCDVRARLRAIAATTKTPLRLVAAWRVKERSCVGWPVWRSAWSNRYAEADLHGRLQRWALGHEWFSPGAAPTVRRLRGRPYPVVGFPPQARYFSRGEFVLYLDAFHAHGRSPKAAYEAVQSVRRCQRMRAQISALKVQNRKLRERPFRIVEAA